MAENVDHIVRAWIMSFPGLITASSPSEVLEMARVACGGGRQAGRGDLEIERLGRRQKGQHVIVLESPRGLRGR